MELARVRTGEAEPAPEPTRAAIGDAIAHCVFGVDKNPLAVEICRIALWLESHDADRPLAFLDHRIRTGDALVGVFNRDCLKDGIPEQQKLACDRWFDLLPAADGGRPD